MLSYCVKVWSPLQGNNAWPTHAQFDLILISRRAPLGRLSVKMKTYKVIINISHLRWHFQHSILLQFNTFLSFEKKDQCLQRTLQIKNFDLQFIYESCFATFFKVSTIVINFHLVLSPRSLLRPKAKSHKSFNSGPGL